MCFWFQQIRLFFDRSGMMDFLKSTLKDTTAKEKVVGLAIAI